MKIMGDDSSGPLAKYGLCGQHRKAVMVRMIVNNLNTLGCYYIPNLNSIVLDYTHCCDFKIYIRI